MYSIKRISHIAVLLASATILGLAYAPLHAQPAGKPTSGGNIAQEMQTAQKLSSQGNDLEALDHLEKALDISVKAHGTQHSDSIRIKSEIGFLYMKMKKYAEARETLAQAVELAKGKSDSKIETVKMYSNLGAIFCQMGEFQESLDWHHKANAIRGRKLDSSSTDPSESCIVKHIISEEIVREAQAGKKLADQQKYSDALIHYNKAVQLSIKKNGDQHKDTAQYKNEVGILYLNLKKYADAQAVLTQAAAIAEKNTDIFASAKIYNNLGAAYYYQGNYKKALVWDEKAFDAIEKSGVSDNVLLTNICDSIVSGYEHLNEPGKAGEWRQKAKAIREKAPSTTAAESNSATPESAADIKNTAQTYLEKGDFDDAITLYKQALELEEKTLGYQHPDTIATCDSLAKAYDKKGDYKEALAWYEKVLNYIENRQSKKSLSAAVIYSNIAVAQARLGNNKKAIENLRKATMVFEKSEFRDHLDVGTVYSNITWVYAKTRDYAKAEEWAKKTLAFNERIYGNEHPATGVAYENVGMTYINRRLYDKAVAPYLRAYRISLNKFGESTQTQSIRVHLECAYNHINKDINNPAPFDEWLAKSLGIAKSEAGANAYTGPRGCKAIPKQVSTTIPAHSTP
ncbi:MAG: DUF3856 domain-containing protein [Azoarcus sp.]|jgi:tetratricopeptide (TPR) repeat protein|nr:DUF3856 domain-containing protein [Azoarcus sp.]